MSGRAGRRLLWLVIVAGGLVAEAAGFGLGAPGDWIPDLLTGWTLAGGGLIAWERRPESWSGPLLLATGGLWFAGTTSSTVAYVYRGPLLHATLAYPRGWPRGFFLVATVAAAYVLSAIPAVWRSAGVSLALAGGFVALAVARRGAAVGRERRERTYALGATAGVSALVAGAAGVRLIVQTPAADDLSLVAFEAGLCAVTIWMVVALWRAPWATAHATDLMVDLSESRTGGLRDRLAHALGDPGLAVGFHVDGAFVDAAGERIELPPPASARRATVIERGGRPVAVLIHDRAVLEDPSLRASLAEAADLASANAALEGELRTQVEQLRESRRRLVVAADEERRRLERRLQETAERRLERLLEELSAPAAGADAGALADLRDQLDQSLVDLRRLAAGLHPRELDEGGLPTALLALAERSPVPVDLHFADVGDVAPETARTAYFVCSEGLANVVKYAEASRAALTIAAAEGRLRIEIADDGRGGADPVQGSGLRGLADRVDAVGGKLTVQSPPGGGTQLTAELPLTGSP